MAKKTVVTLRRTKDCPCPVGTSPVAKRLWAELRGKTLVVDNERYGGSMKCGSRKLRRVLEEMAVTRRNDLSKKLGHPTAPEYFICGHVILRESK